MTRIDSLTGLRGIACVAVVLEHYSEHHTQVSWPGCFIGIGDHAVSVFFVLSGALMALTYVQCDAMRWPECRSSFYWKRFFRIAPMYWFGLLVDVPRLIEIAPTLHAGEWLYTSLMPFGAQGAVWFWKPDYFAVGWTLTIEIYSYALFPFLMLHSWAHETLILAGLLFTQYFSLIWHVLIDHGYKFNTLTRIEEFIIAAVATKAMIRHQWSIPDVFVPLLPSLLFLCWLIVPSIASKQQELWDLSVLPGFYTLFELLVVFALIQQHWFNDLLFANRFSVWLGDISFAVYVVHIPLIRWSRSYLEPWTYELFDLIEFQSWPSALIGFGVFFITLFSMAHALHYWIERPLHKLLVSRFVVPHECPLKIVITLDEISEGI